LPVHDHPVSAFNGIQYSSSCDSGNKPAHVVVKDSCHLFEIWGFDGGEY